MFSNVEPMTDKEKMRMSYKFDVPAVYFEGVHWFPEDIEGNKIEGVFYRGKYRQDTFTKSDEFLTKIKEYYNEHLR